MSIPLRQSLVIGRYLMRQRLRKNDKFPLLVELEPLYQCNLACSFCGKIQYPDHVLRKRMPVAEALAAIDYLHEVGLEAIEAHERELTAYALELLADLPGIVTYGPSLERRAGSRSSIPRST